ncbi:META domain-containing protein [uncultured Alistipes sp.]|jgi:heat shock protein|uniref:META domain-containing protein n=1 Tax=uncultured Alistipes sp. TaxID=538949 RepID=UPI0025EE3B7C|nr:META domain-containing protein [uncultured Alistipes sp.]
MKTLLKIAVVIAIAAFAASCCNCRNAQKKARKPLVGTEWQLIQLEGQSIKPEEGKFTLKFLAEENRVSGVGACNRLNGKYETSGKNALKIGPLASTMMACPGMDLEGKYAKVLEATTHYDMDGPMLLLLSNGELQAVFQAKP